MCVNTCTHGEANVFANTCAHMERVRKEQEWVRKSIMDASTSEDEFRLSSASGWSVGGSTSERGGLMITDTKLLGGLTPGVGDLRQVLDLEGSLGKECGADVLVVDDIFELDTFS